MTTSSEKARSKLLDSMRISKSGVSETPEASKPAAPAKPEKKAAPKTKAKKSAPKKTAKKKANKSSAGAFVSGHSAGIAADSYQSTGRIWPD
jgi:hypothetical protein